MLGQFFLLFSRFVFFCIFWYDQKKIWKYLVMLQCSKYDAKFMWQKKIPFCDTKKEEKMWQKLLKYCYNRLMIDDLYFYFISKHKFEKNKSFSKLRYRNNKQSLINFKDWRFNFYLPLCLKHIWLRFSFLNFLQFTTRTCAVWVSKVDLICSVCVCLRVCVRACVRVCVSVHLAAAHAHEFLSLHTLQEKKGKKGTSLILIQTPGVNAMK